MKKIIKIRNIEIGENKPKICAPILGKTDDEILVKLEEVKTLKINIVEWRVDYYEYAEDVNAIKSVLKTMRHILKDIPILFTFRSKDEGGMKAISKEYYFLLNNEICDTKLVDLVDIELFTGDDIVRELVAKAHKNNIKVIISSHDFDKTPSKDEIIKRLCKMQELGADIPKIAVMPKDPTDVLTLLCATDEMNKTYATTPIVTMSMSSLGVISRISGEIFGSAITFGSIKEASAPGQIEINKLHSILSTIHAPMADIKNNIN